MNPKLSLFVLASSLTVVAAAAYIKPANATITSPEQTINQRIEKVREALLDKENLNYSEQTNPESEQLISRWANYWSNYCYWVNWYNYGYWANFLNC